MGKGAPPAPRKYRRMVKNEGGKIVSALYLDSDLSGLFTGP